MNTQYIDLGLPSGRLWATENAVIDGKEYFNFDEAVEAFDDRLPSAEAWQELFDNCDKQWDKKQKGYTLTGPNGNSLFLPAAGFCFGSGCDHVRTSGLYVSSSAIDEVHFRGLTFHHGYIAPQSLTHRYNGYSVRLCKPAGAQ